MVLNLKSQPYFLCILVSTIVSYFCTMFAFGLPYWYAKWPSAQTSFKSIGLWEICLDQYMTDAIYNEIYSDCYSLFYSEIKQLRSLVVKTWLTVAQALYTLNLILSALVLILVLCLLLSKTAYRKPSHAKALLGLDVLLALCDFAVLLLVAIGFKREETLTRPSYWLFNASQNTLSWSYALAGVAMLARFVSLAVLGIVLDKAGLAVSHRARLSHSRMQPELQHYGIDWSFISRKELRFRAQQNQQFEEDQQHLQMTSQFGGERSNYVGSVISSSTAAFPAAPSQSSTMIAARLNYRAMPNNAGGSTTALKIELRNATARHHPAASLSSTAHRYGSSHSLFSGSLLTGSTANSATNPRDLVVAKPIGYEKKKFHKFHQTSASITNLSVALSEDTHSSHHTAAHQHAGGTAAFELNQYNRKQQSRDLKHRTKHNQDFESEANRSVISSYGTRPVSPPSTLTGSQSNLLVVSATPAAQHLQHNNTASNIMAARPMKRKR